TSAPTAKAPGGLLRRVTGVHADGVGTVADTVQAGLDEVFRRADTQVTEPLDFGSAAGAPAAPKSTRVIVGGAPLTVPINVDFDLGNDAHLHVTGSSTFNAGIDFGVHIGFDGIKSHAVTFASWKQDLDVELTKAFTGGPPPKDIYEHHFAPR